MLVVKVIGNYNGIEEIIKKLTGSEDGILNNIQFTTSDIKEADGILVLNEPYSKLEIKANKKMIFAAFQEPGKFLSHPYMYFNRKNYSKIFSPINFMDEKNVELSHGYLPWHITEDLKSLENGKLNINKTKLLSCISSNARRLKGHRLRYDFVEFLKKKNIECEFFGKGYRYVENKAEALEEFKYSIAIENENIDYYFTEKITDCFLSYTVPIYFGCRNIDKFFPENSFINIDLNRSFDWNYNMIKDIIKHDNYNDRIESLIEARKLVMTEYNIFYKISKEMKDFYSLDKNLKKDLIILKPINSYLKYFLIFLHRFIYKIYNIPSKFKTI